MSVEFPFLMIGAMYENGGNTSHRFLDGHPQLYVYPFESQLGTRLVVDHLSSMFPVKYRWPTFALQATSEEDYFAIIDEEGKVRARTPSVSKFRLHAFELDDEERRDVFRRYVDETGRSRASNVAAFFKATFDVWKNFSRCGRESTYVGYSPIITVDADKILSDLPKGYFLHVVRNPWSAYADTKKRPVPLSLATYMLGWTINQYYALLFRELYPERFYIVRIEDVITDPVETLGTVLERMGLERSDSLARPSWNGQLLDEVYPWGTIRTPTTDANRATASELSDDEREEIRVRSTHYLDAFDYADFMNSVSAAG
jgi:hypothetical protein